MNFIFLALELKFTLGFTPKFTSNYQRILYFAHIFLLF